LNASALKQNMSDFIPFVQELLEGLGPVTARRMFGGHGLYHEGLMFAIVMDNRLYLKVDALNRPDFEALGLTPFTYPMKGREVALSYWSAPDAIFDEPSEAVRWARSAWDAAARGQAAKAARPRRGVSRKSGPFSA
jgi:DNA transformation protein and related proteins